MKKSTKPKSKDSKDFKKNKKFSKKKDSSVFALLKAEHKDLKELLEKTEKSDPEDREECLKEVCKELIPHARAEEKTLYALFRRRALDEDTETLDLANEGYEEHLVADTLIENLKYLDTDDERWIPMFKVLKENLEHHIREEESEIFKGCKKIFSKEEQGLMLEAYLTSKKSFMDNLKSQAEIDEREPSVEVETMLSLQ